MKRFALLSLLVLLTFFAVNATVPKAEAWGCAPGQPFCTVGNHAQCDSWCGHAGWGQCYAPGCCWCLG